MEGILDRQLYEDKQTLGVLQLLDDHGCIVFQAKTLELPWKNNKFQISCIPKGTYNVVPRRSAKYGNHFHVTDVKNRTYILIHGGNYHFQIKGCILIGQGHKDINGDGYRDVTSSKYTLKLLKKIAPKGFKLKIQ